MKLLILGSGGREHAIAWRLSRDPEQHEVLIAPGNPGTAEVGRNVPVDLNSPEAILELVEREAVDLTIVGPEAPLERGVADRFRQAGRPIVGPTRLGAALECSKAHAKAFMATHSIPTARFEVFSDPKLALDAVAGPAFGFPVVVKANGLAAGKGVTVAEDRETAEAAVRAAMVDRQFGQAGDKVVIEECLRGPELSMFYLLDGRRGVYLGSAQDHKRIFDNDEGPNTGGMGAFAPSPLVTEELERTVARDIVGAVLTGHLAQGEPYIGFLYVSLMLTADGPKVIEFNVRFGDPEAQVVLPLLEGNFADLLHAAATGALGSASVPAPRMKAVGVVLASRGYPASAESGRPITGLGRTAADRLVFHAGTRSEGGRVVTAGGRVLTVVATESTFEEAISASYSLVESIQFDGMQYRRDIGQRAISATQGTRA